jgi:hypothetical protein
MNKNKLKVESFFIRRIVNCSMFFESIRKFGKYIPIKKDDRNGVVFSNADCQSKGPGFESQVSHGPFQKV